MENDKAIKDGVAKLASLGAKFILVILPMNDPKLYASVKCAGDLISGVNTVCVVGKKFCNEKG